MRKRRCTASLVAALMITAPAMGQTSVKEGLNILSEKHGVHFVYDASMELDMPYDGKPIVPLGQSRYVFLVERKSSEMISTTVFDKASQ